MSAPAQLSDREFEVFELIGQGLSTHDIATRLHLSVKTVRVHRANVKRKLDVETSSKLISYAARWIEHRRSNISSAGAGARTPAAGVGETASANGM